MGKIVAVQMSEYLINEIARIQKITDLTKTDVVRRMVEHCVLEHESNRLFPIYSGQFTTSHVQGQI